MAQKTKQRQCEKCGQSVLAVANKPSFLGHAMHVTLSVCTVGLWLFVYLPRALGGYRCPNCGSRV